MNGYRIGTREEWLKARFEMLEAEKELTRRSDELARRRQELPWVRISKEYRFETDEGSASLLTVNALIPVRRASARLMGHELTPAIGPRGDRCSRTAKIIT